MKVSDLVRVLDSIAPLVYAEDWDNVGLLAGDPGAPVTRVLFCIDCTRAVLDEAVAGGFDAVVSYHPPLFRPVSRLTGGSVVFDAIRRGIAIYSPHTALDAAPGGTNDVLADAVGMSRDRAPLRESVVKEPSGYGMGRVGALERPMEMPALVARVKEGLGVAHVLVAGPESPRALSRIAVCAGSAGELLDAAIRQKADVVVGGEVRHHDALRAAEAGVSLVCALHSNSERIALEPLRARVVAGMPGLHTATSRADRDPFSIA
jgi:dinuclear metal center YbgI/SA1388 family protein